MNTMEITTDGKRRPRPGSERDTPMQRSGVDPGQPWRLPLNDEYPVTNDESRCARGSPCPVFAAPYPPSLLAAKLAVRIQWLRQKPEEPQDKMIP